MRLVRGLARERELLAQGEAQSGKAGWWAGKQAEQAGLAGQAQALGSWRHVTCVCRSKG